MEMPLSVAATPPTPGVPDERLVDLVLSRFEHSAQYFQKSNSKVREQYDLARCIYTGKRLPFKNVVMLPLVHGACRSDVAFKAQTIFGAWPWIEFESDAPEDAPRMKRLDALINGQLRDARSYEKSVDFLGSASIYGTAVARVGWKKVVRPHKYRRQVMNYSFIQEGQMTEFDGPDWENVDILDFFPQPGPKFIESMSWVCHRYYEDLDNLRDAQFGDMPIFDPARIKLLETKPLNGPAVNDYYERQNVWRSYYEFQTRRDEKHAKPIELIDMIGLVPAEFAPDGYRLRILTIANRNVLLRNECLPFWNLTQLFRAYTPMPDPHYFRGVGKAEIVSKLAAVANKLVSLRLDSIEMFLGPSFFASTASGLNTSNLVLYPGKLIRTNGPVDDTQIRPISPDIRGMQMSHEEVAAISRYIQQAMGVAEDTMQGLAGGDRQTAREFLGRMEMGKNRLAQETILFEKMFFEPLAMDFLKLDQQALPMPRWIKRLGSSALIDPDTGFPLPPEQEPMSLDDLNVDARPRSLGSSNMLGKQTKMQNLTMGGQFAMANPVGMQTTNWTSFWAQYWRALDLNPAEMMLTKANELNMMGAMEGSGMPGQGGAGGMEALDPTRLAYQPQNNLMPVGGMQ